MLAGAGDLVGPLLVGSLHRRYRDLEVAVDLVARGIPQAATFV